MGLIRKPNSKFWWINLKVGHKRIFESTKTENKKKAQEILSIRHAELLGGISHPAANEPQEVKETKAYTFSELAEEYLKYASGRLKSYGRLISFTKKLMETFGDIKLIDFNSKIIENMQTNIINKGQSISYANRLVAALKSMMAKALDWDMITEDDLKRIRKAKQLKGEIKRLRYLSDEEAERLISNCESYLKPIVIMALNTGMRRGEIFGLTWERVDLKNRIILLDKTKNGERREIPINETLYKTLSGIIRRLDCKYVFYNPKTLKPFDNTKRSWQTALKKSYILDFHFHDLRHTFASWLVMKGIDLATVKDLMGHKDITMTLRYSHLSKPHIKSAISVLDKKCDTCVTVGDFKENGNS